MGLIQKRAELFFAILWTIFYHGLLRRICAWAKTWFQMAIVKRLLEELRLMRRAEPEFRVGQLRFVDTYTE